MKQVITYIPSSEVEYCEVCKIYNLTKYNNIQLMIKKCKQLLVRSNNPQLISMIKNTNVEQIICFGYKHDEYPILLTSEKEYISADWFGNQFKIGIFFIKNSSTLFTSNNTIWVEKFNNWVSFSETFQPFVDYKDSVDLQQQMYKEFMKELVNIKTSVDISYSLKKIYDKYIEKFSVLCHDDNIDSNNLINTINVLQMNKESIIYG
ncbi:hypothetical protein [Flavobacterium sp.]|uniref:hypothetical protein n=1 Tax=Flavobacterium sp. TaxID=239 RepID=UPI002634F5B9|nr:hypothetical protein [Flavobacterium sp.]